MSEKKERITRRDFLRGTASAALAAAVGLPLASCRAVAQQAGQEAQAQAQPPAPQAERRAKVVLVRDQAAVGEDGTVNEEVVGRMLDEAVCALTDKGTPAEAWAELVKPGDLVGLKSNEWHPLATPQEVERVLVRRIADVGVPGDTVRISDRGARTVLADRTALINVRPLRTHHWSGIGGCIKNYIMFSDRPYQYHDNACESLALAWELPECKGKTRLNILLALTPQFYGRGPHAFDPRHVWPYRGMFVSFDPVACDALGAELLRAKRIAVFGEEQPLTPTTHIAAADEKYGLGVADLNRIDIIRLGWTEDSLI
ncbi:MAG: DUF362 domain-containing protein [Armatimonadetes bacterium]|nr:DUF362 domain-containing protein [Armatimonadota bacterium]